MNRLVIIGNGFDLAHGLPTGYCDFIDDYWRNVLLNFDRKINKSNYSDNLIDISYEFMQTGFNSAVKKIEQVKNYRDFASFIGEYSSGFNTYQYTDKNGCRINFKNKFFKNICELHSITNWVDVENQYYQQLKKIVKLPRKVLNVTEEQHTLNKREKVENLNKEFDSVKVLFEEYLNEKVIKQYNFGNYRDPAGDCLKFPEIFKPTFFKTMSTELFQFLNEFPIPYQKELEDLFTHKKNIVDYVSRIALLNFNYTPTTNKYVRDLNSSGVDAKIIHIHGYVGGKENSINFGFGDEMDDDYKIIENIDDNEYLRNFKSFQYLHTSNYKELLDFIDSEKFQVYIMGHSCGLSDRTLLNTVFEHTNCISIKVFYHKKEDDTDNYTEITQNISRHFNKKKLMREKIVNKTLCQPLPQIQLPKKEL